MTLSKVKEIEIAEHGSETFSIAADVDMSVVKLRDMVLALLRPPAATSSTTVMVSCSYKA
jgi:hypothetical protein